MLPASPASRVCTSRSIRPSCWTAAVTSAAAPITTITNWAANTARGTDLDQAGQRSSGPAVQGPARTPGRRRRDDRAHHGGSAYGLKGLPEQQRGGHQGGEIGDRHDHRDAEHGRAAAGCGSGRAANPAQRTIKNPITRRNPRDQRDVRPPT